MLLLNNPIDRSAFLKWGGYAVPGSSEITDYLFGSDCFYIIDWYREINVLCVIELICNHSHPDNFSMVIKNRSAAASH